MKTVTVVVIKLSAYDADHAALNSPGDSTVWWGRGRGLMCLLCLLTDVVAGERHNVRGVQRFSGRVCGQIARRYRWSVYTRILVVYSYVIGSDVDKCFEAR